MRSVVVATKWTLGVFLAFAILSGVSLVFSFLPPDLQQYANVGAYGTLFAVVVLWTLLDRN